MDRKWLGFCVRAENYLFLVRGSFDLVFVRLVELTWFLYAGLKSLGFSVNIELDFVFVWVGKIDFDLIVGDRNWIGCGGGVENYLVLVLGSNLLVFSMGIEID